MINRCSLLIIKHAVLYFFLLAAFLLPVPGKCGKDKDASRIMQCSDTSEGTYVPSFSASSIYIYSAKAGVLGSTDSHSCVPPAASIVPTLAIMEQVKTVVQGTCQEFEKTLVDHDKTIQGFSLGDYQITPEVVRRDYKKVYMDFVVVSDLAKEDEEDRQFAREIFGSGLLLTKLVLDVCNKVCASLDKKNQELVATKKEEERKKIKSRVKQMSSYRDCLRELFLRGGVQILCHIKDEQQMLAVVHKLASKRTLVNFLNDMERNQKFSGGSLDDATIEDFALSLSRGYKVLHNLLFNYGDNAGFALNAIFDQILIDPEYMVRQFHSAPMFFVFSALTRKVETRDLFLVRENDEVVSLQVAQEHFSGVIEEVKETKTADGKNDKYRGIRNARGCLVKYLKESFYSVREDRWSDCRKPWDSLKDEEAELIADRWVYALLKQHALYSDINGVAFNATAYSRTVNDLFNSKVDRGDYIPDGICAQYLISALEYTEPVRIIYDVISKFKKSLDPYKKAYQEQKTGLAKHARSLAEGKGMSFKPDGFIRLVNELEGKKGKLDKYDATKSRVFDDALYLMASLVNPNARVKLKGEVVGNSSLWPLFKITVFYANALYRSTQVHMAETSRMRFANTFGTRYGNQWIADMVCGEDLPHFASRDTNLSIVASTLYRTEWNRDKPEKPEQWNRFFKELYEKTMAQPLPENIRL